MFPFFAVEKASLRFMDGHTTIKAETSPGIFTSKKTDLLCFVTDPEEKRKIIGDTFMDVAKKVSLAANIDSRVFRRCEVFHG